MLMKVEDIIILVLDKRLEGVLIIFKDFLIEDVVNVGGEVGAKVSRDEYSSLLVENVDR